MDKDLVHRPFGRFFYLPSLLAKRGHDVYILLLSYQNDPDLAMKKHGIHYFSVSIIKFGLLGYIKAATDIILKIKPDWIIGVSDTYFGIMAQYFGKKYKIKSAIDAYDNFESYIPWFKPLHYSWRKAVSRATLITAAGPYLGQYLNRFRPDKNVQIVPMAADPDKFKPMNRADCRRKLGLPLNKKLIGYCGSIYRNRGIEIIFRAFEQLLNISPDLEIDMVLAGRKQKSVHIPDKVQCLGYLPDDYIPFFLNSIDVLLVINKLSAFGEHSYPVKLYEAMKCHIPVVASDTPATNWILKNNRNFLSAPENPKELAGKIKQALKLGRYDYKNNDTWSHSCNIFEHLLFSHLL